MSAKSIHQLTPEQAGTESALSSRVRPVVLRLLSMLSQNRLTIHDDGEVFEFGAAKGGIHAEVYVRSPLAYQLMATKGILGAGEAYILGYWDTKDLVSTVRFFCSNMPTMKSINRRRSLWNSVVNFGINAMSRNSLVGSKRNIVAHYDLSNEFFQTMLDSKMMYSSAIYNEQHQDLESASTYKLKHVCERLSLSPADHLLEIGCGWGGLAIYAAKHYGCKVTAVTISDEQFGYAQQAIEQQGLSDKITLLNQDYRTLTGKYDKLVSIEMIEAVGHKYHDVYFKQCSDLLKPNGKLLIQAITIADQRYTAYRQSVDFIQRYIFPGGCLPSLSVINEKFSSKTDMQVVGVEDITKSYALTIHEWRDRFLHAYESIKAMGFDKRFMRMWDFYLAYCEGAFEERAISTVQVLAAKPGCKDLPTLKSL